MPGRRKCERPALDQKKLKKGEERREDALFLNFIHGMVGFNQQSFHIGPIVENRACPMLTPT